MIDIQFFLPHNAGESKETGKTLFPYSVSPFFLVSVFKYKDTEEQNGKKMDKYNFNDIYMLTTIRSARRDICI